MARIHKVAAVAAIAALSLTACSGGDDAPKATPTATGAPTGDIKGTVTVLTNRTDLTKTVFPAYVAEFQKEYPGVEVKFEAHTDYEGEVSIRMGTEQYGDVLLIPNKITKDQFPQYFEPIGTVDEAAKTYRFVKTEGSLDGTLYGLAITGNASGYVVNTKVMAEGGVTTPPKTPEEFLTALKAVKDKTGAGYYTNYKDGWPLSQWQGNQGVIAGPDSVTIRDSQDAPWTEGNEQYAFDSLLFDIVNQGLSESDPTTTNWEESKVKLAKGEISSMVLGGWAVSQMKEAAEKNGGSADDIAFWPLPFTTDGKLHSVVSGDYKIAINKHSKNKDAAKAWLTWFIDKSGYAFDQGGVSPRLDGKTPDTLKAFDEVGAEFVDLNPSPTGEESLDSDIYNEAEIDLWGDSYRRKLVDIARGAEKGDKASYFTSLNEKWAKARAEFAKN
ncbi:ABC transporter substrate-binding protein [Sanguibacter sp. HDW7]|uniref:ABC transporter substrate-binding protein n=1 Tax=Sanguibacter sp. HDW7 TaxID=2714931 RepID=UPI00140D6B72|nr:extracellular solute-binding protein [Sanguibacter sp. HDW7]QIK84675.1 extracellular solute-binding protein [Sanguibacter sp. HDW7]